MQKVREHQLAVHNAQARRDDERRRTDPEFQPRDDDFDAPPVRPFDANENYYKYLGLSENATADQVRKAYKKMCLKYHPDKLRQTGRSIKMGKDATREEIEEEAKETFLSIQEAFEILGDQATRRQYDRQRISEAELDKQYDHRQNRRKENEENAWKPPPTWKPKLKEILKKGKQVKTPAKHVPVVVTLEEILTGCERTVTFERNVVGRTGKLHAQTKSYRVEVRRGELASRKWEYPGEAGVSQADALPGDLVLQLQVEAPRNATVRRVGVDLEAERVVDCGDLAPGSFFHAAVKTLRGAVVAVCGRAPDRRGRRGDLVAGKLVLTVRVPNEGLPLLDAPHCRGCLVVKFAFGAGYDEARRHGTAADAPRPRRLAAADAERAKKRKFETVALRPRRVDYGVDGKLVFSDSFMPRRAQPLRKKAGAKAEAPVDDGRKREQILAGPDCRICAASLRLTSDDPAPYDLGALLLGATWFTMKWHHAFRDRLSDVERFPNLLGWRDATIGVDPDAEGYVEPRNFEAAPEAPTYAAVIVEVDETAGMDDDMKARHRARKAKEKAQREKMMEVEKRRIANRRGRDGAAPSHADPPPYVAAPPPPRPAFSPRSVADSAVAADEDPVDNLTKLQYKEADRRRRAAMQDAGGTTLPAVKPPVIPVTDKTNNVLLNRTPAETPRFHAISNEPQVIVVAGNSGASVRAGPRVDSNKVGELAKGERVSYTGTQVVCDGRPRVEIDKPLRGWISLKLCGPAPPEAPKDPDESELE